MDLKTTRCERGAFATVVIDRDNQRAYKLFKNNRHPDYSGEDNFDDERNKLVFAAETEAYKIIATIPDLQKHAPEFFGIQKIDRVLNHEESDISSHYLLDCCYCMRLCGGNDKKYGQCRLPYIDEFARLMVQHGIRYVIDSSVFNPDSESDFVFIDFATRDAAADFDVQQALA